MFANANRQTASEPTKDRQSQSDQASQPNLVTPPAISLPKGGGAIRGMGEKFAANPVTGTGSMSVPLATSPGRGGFGPQLALSYDSGAGNGPFGFGWNLSLPAITRKTDKGLPQYNDPGESDVFLLSGAEDLVPTLVEGNGQWQREPVIQRAVGGKRYQIQRYRPRIEGLFARIERWTNQADASDSFWRSIAKENVTTWYGKSAESRIADPADPTRIFSWLICESHDDKGNVLVYGYKAEDSAGIDVAQAHERNRSEQNRSAQRYLKRIRYGNHQSYLPKLEQNQPLPQLPDTGNWYFEVVFDYGDHDVTAPLPNEPGKSWAVRGDPFSTYRAGFEVRTYRLCQRVLMFHHFVGQAAGEAEVGNDCLVRSTDFTYSVETDPTNARNPVYTFLQSATQTGYKRANGGYLKRSLPPVEFEYSQPVVQDQVQEVDGESIANLPIGLDGSAYQWTDLHGEGIPGILSEQAGAWFYKRNLSPLQPHPNPPQLGEGTVPPQIPTGTGRLGGGAHFAPIELVASKPNFALAGGAQLMDLAGDGQPDLVVFDGALSGFYEHDGAEGWQPFRSFSDRLQRDLRDPNLKWLDVDGDGHTDLLISEENAFVWHRSLAEAGFAPAQRVVKAWDEEQGAHIVFANNEESIYLADLSGDGLSDIVRIRNGEVCYWPNLGYGRFGAKVTMDNAPLFDRPDQFEQKRIRLADIDGSGTTDIIYLHGDGVRLYFNQSGNSWSQAQPLAFFPPIDDLTTITPVDLLGNGTACLVWSSALPGAARRPMRYVNLMGGQKPHLLVKTRNNLGAETEVHYAPSTHFYLQDKLAGTPWITKLPFPVHVVTKLTVKDQWRQTTFTTRYSYHHGYFDGAEREFRGFGRVEQVDVEEYGAFANGNSASPYITPDQRLYQPPIKMVTWFHTGALIDRERILNHLQGEYFPHCLEALHPGQQLLGDFQENHLPQPDLTQLDLSADEWRQALRACKGMTLRQEIYELDVDALAQGEVVAVKLFSAADHNCHIHRLQPQLEHAQADHRHAVFLVTESEAITYHYELDLRPALSGGTLTPDPRIAHTLNLRIDELGNIQQAVSVVYPRRQQHNDGTLPAAANKLIQHVQGELHLAYSETRYTDDVLAADAYRLRLPCGVQTYELTGIAPRSAGDATTDDAIDDRYFTLAELRAFRLSDHYQTTGTAVASIPYHQLPDRTTPQKRLVEETRTLFFKPSLDKWEDFGTLNALALPYESYQLALTDALLNAIFAAKLQPDVLGRLNDKTKSGYLSGADLTARLGDDTAGQYWLCSGVAGFNADAPDHFYLPERYTDPFGNPTTLNYDGRDLFIQSSTDAVGNQTAVEAFDYRVLAPRRMKDPNDNRSEVRFDLLGMPTAMALLGEDDGSEGDNLTGFNDAALNPDLATVIDFFVNNPYDVATAKTLLGNATARHLYYFGEKVENGKILWGQHPSCAAGIVREQHLAQNANSPVQSAFEYSDGMGNVLVKKVQAEPEAPGTPLRWVASGKTILNNKGKPVKQYEPYFSPAATGHRFEEPAEVGVTAVIYYDAPGRVIRTELPDGSYSRVEFSPWHVTSYDGNDTVLEAGNGWFARMSASAKPEEQRAAQLAAQHADTPATTLLDSLGREVISIAHNRDAGTDEKYITFSKLDAEGKPLWVQDARGNRVMQYITPPLPEGQKPFDDGQNLNSQGFAPAYDIAGNLLFQHSMDAGDRWLLNDAAGKPMVGWNSRGFITWVAYDELHRPTGSFVIATGETTLSGAPRDPAAPPDAPVQFEKLVYGEGQAGNNLRGQLYQHFDTAGVVTVDDYDFKGNPLRSTRQFASDYKGTPDWSASPDLEAELFITQTAYDALNRPTRITTPDDSVTVPEFNEANLLNGVQVNVREAAATTLVSNIDYNAKGQRQLIAYGNGVTTRYDYDAQSFRLINLKSTRPPQPDATASALFKTATTVQDLHYTYDPVGNITRIADAAHLTIFCSNQQVEAISDYSYDALYRLTAASGRERKEATQSDWDDRGKIIAMPPDSGIALGCYVEGYAYDAVGNIMQMIHHAGSNVDAPGSVTWNRRYQYAADNNRLLATSLPGDGEGSFSAPYAYDLHGNMSQMPHLPTMRWDFKDQLRASAQQVVNGGTPVITYYVYDAAGQRVRKVTENQNGTRTKERRYLGGYEVYRKYANSGAVELERQTLHVMDDQQRIALVETKTVDTQSPVSSLQSLIRFQLGNHLGSASLELDADGALISYDEYTPYGGTAYCAGRNAAEASLKRYRYTGMERDEETGLNYHGARYYAAWLGRWVSVDPLFDQFPWISPYLGFNADPINLVDPDGQQAIPPKTTGIHVHNIKQGETLTDIAHQHSLNVDDLAAWNRIVDRNKIRAGDTLIVSNPSIAQLDAESDGDRIVLEEYKEVQEPYQETHTVYETVTETKKVRGGGSIMMGGLAAGAIVSQLDSPVPGPGDVGGALIIGGAAIVAGAAWLFISRTITTTRVVPRTVTATRTRTRRQRLPLTYVTYMKFNAKTGETYWGRAAGYGNPYSIVAARDRTHHKTSKGFGPAELDGVSVATLSHARRRLDPSYQAIRGREQQGIDFQGGAWSDVGRRNTKSGNEIRGVAKAHKQGQIFHWAANLLFGNLAPYTGN